MAVAPLSLAPWSQQRGVEAVLDEWLAEGAVSRCFEAERLIEAQPGSSVEAPSELNPKLRRALTEMGVSSLYAHQAEAVQAALSGRHVVIATPTASGKSLCFHLPVLQAIEEDPRACALYLYPTKALSRDQETSLWSFIKSAELNVGAMVFDGDTPGDARRAVRERARIVLTNPDMLHAGILPNHPRWAALFQNLKYVILDELHTYRGVFGSHMAHVLARLKRIARFHGADPQFIMATATIGNPLAHAARLIGVPESDVTLIDKSAAPASSRQVFVYNPPIVNAELGVRASALKHAVSLAADLVKARVPTIVFGPSRNSVELMLKYLRQRTRGDIPADALTAYRGGYLPEVRRGIERGLREGEILGVVATNALELGVDIGDLTAVVCVGYPGSIAGTWQRFGRAGRRGKTSIAVLVCNSNALDQFLAREPEYLFKTQAEEARIDPGNVEILIQHLKCATFEAPFRINPPGERLPSPDPPIGEGYADLDPGATRDALDYLVKQGLVHDASDGYHWASDAYPASHVSLRNVGWDNFVIIDLDTDRTLAELDWRATHTMLHEQAIYQHDAEQYQVERLDYDNHKAYVRKVEPDYFTTALTYRSVEVLEEHASRPLGRLELGAGDVKVIEKVTGYKKIKFFTHENAGYGDVHLPEMQMHTTSCWLTVPEHVLESVGVPRATLIDALRGAGVALETVATLTLMCEPRDINRTLGDGGGDQAPGRNPHERRTGQFNPTLFLFDAVPGGVGLSPRIFDRAESLVGAARSLIESCSCAVGCPACIGPSEPGPDSRTNKALASRILELAATPARSLHTD